MEQIYGISKSRREHLWALRAWQRCRRQFFHGRVFVVALLLVANVVPLVASQEIRLPKPPFIRIRFDAEAPSLPSAELVAACPEAEAACKSNREAYNTIVADYQKTLPEYEPAYKRWDAAAKRYDTAARGYKSALEWRLTTIDQVNHHYATSADLVAANAKLDAADQELTKATAELQNAQEALLKIWTVLNELSLKATTAWYQLRNCLEKANKNCHHASGTPADTNANPGQSVNPSPAPTTPSPSTPAGAAPPQGKFVVDTSGVKAGFHEPDLPTVPIDPVDYGPSSRQRIPGLKKEPAQESPRTQSQPQTTPAQQPPPTGAGSGPGNPAGATHAQASANGAANQAVNNAVSTTIQNSTTTAYDNSLRNGAIVGQNLSPNSPLSTVGVPASGTAIERTQIRPYGFPVWLSPGTNWSVTSDGTVVIADHDGNVSQTIAKTENGITLITYSINGSPSDSYNASLSGGVSGWKETRQYSDGRKEVLVSNADGILGVVTLSADGSNYQVWRPYGAGREKWSLIPTTRGRLPSNPSQAADVVDSLLTSAVNEGFVVQPSAGGTNAAPTEAAPQSPTAPAPQDGTSKSENAHHGDPLTVPPYAQAQGYSTSTNSDGSLLVTTPSGNTFRLYRDDKGQLQTGSVTVNYSVGYSPPLTSVQTNSPADTKKQNDTVKTHSTPAKAPDEVAQASGSVLASDVVGATSTPASNPSRVVVVPIVGGSLTVTIGPPINGTRRYGISGASKDEKGQATNYQAFGTIPASVSDTQQIGVILRDAFPGTQPTGNPTTINPGVSAAPSTPPVGCAPNRFTTKLPTLKELRPPLAGRVRQAVLDAGGDPNQASYDSTPTYDCYRWVYGFALPVTDFKKIYTASPDGKPFSLLGHFGEGGDFIVAERSEGDTPPALLGVPSYDRPGAFPQGEGGGLATIGSEMEAAEERRERERAEEEIFRRAIEPARTPPVLPSGVPLGVPIKDKKNAASGDPGTLQPDKPLEPWKLPQPQTYPITPDSSPAKPIGDTSGDPKFTLPVDPSSGGTAKPADSAAKGGTPKHPPTNNAGPGTAVTPGNVKSPEGPKSGTKDANGSPSGAVSGPPGKTLSDAAQAAGLPSPTGVVNGYQPDMKVYGIYVDTRDKDKWEFKANGTVVYTSPSRNSITTISKNEDGSSVARTVISFQSGLEIRDVETPDAFVSVMVHAPGADGKRKYEVQYYSKKGPGFVPVVSSSELPALTGNGTLEGQIDEIIHRYTTPEGGPYDANAGNRQPDVDPSKLPDLTKDLSSGNDTGEKANGPKDSKTAPHDNDKSDAIPKKDDTTSLNPVGAAPAGNVATTSVANAPSLPPKGGGSLLSINSSISGLVNVALSTPIALGVQNVVASGVGIQNASLAPLGRTTAAENLIEKRRISTHPWPPRLQLVALRETFLTFSSPMAAHRTIEKDSGTTDTPNQITYALVANGNSSGEALELQVFDPSGRIKQVEVPEGLVLEPLQMGAAQPLSARVPQGANLLTKQLTAYCVDYLKLPPQVGMLYRLAPQAVQDKFKPIASVLRAGRELAGKGQFHPDSDPTAYNDSIRQYSLWTKLENWGEQKFGEVFLEKTKQNAVSAKVKWTKQMEQAVRGLVPGRWRDISMVLDEAAKLSRTSQTAKP